MHDLALRNTNLKCSGTESEPAKGTRKEQREEEAERARPQGNQGREWPCPQHGSEDGLSLLLKVPGGLTALHSEFPERGSD